MSMDSDVRRMIAEAVAEAKAEMREQFREMIWNLVQFGPVSLSSSSGEDDKVEGLTKDGEDDKAYDYQVKRMQHFGFRSRPPKDVWAIRIGIGGGSTNNATVAEESDQYGPSDLEDGEVAIYNKVTGTEIRFDENGDVIVNGGTKKIARVDDTAKAAAAMKTWMGQVETGITGGGGVAPSPAASTFADVAIAVINSGADHFKG
jgi:phage gp45-like